MDFPIAKCIVTGQHFPAPQVQELLQFPHLLTFILLDLKLLEKEMHKLGEKRTTINNLARNELNRLNTFTLAKRKREWIGGRFAAKYAISRLLEQVVSQTNIPPWSDNIIIADENGRPFLSASKESTKQPMPDISISHSGSMAAAMAVHKGYCGIDIQKVTQKIFKVKDRFCTHNEYRILEDFFTVGPKNQAAHLTTLWAAKEALRKASFMSSLPGFMELELIRITADPLQKKAGFWSFSFTWKSSAGPAHKKSIVAVTNIGDYTLALTARDDTAD